MDKPVKTGFDIRPTALPLLETEQPQHEKAVKWRVSKSDLKHSKEIFDLLLSSMQAVITIFHHFQERL